MSLFTFEENKTVKDLSSVPNHYHSLYEQGSEGFTLKETPELSGLYKGIDITAKALASERVGRSEDQKKIVDLTALSAYGTSVDEIAQGVQAKVEELQAEINKGSQAKLDIDKIKEDLAKANATEIAKRDKSIENLTGQLHELTINRGLSDALDKHGAKADNKELLSLALGQNIRMVEDNGKFVERIVDDSGNVRYSGATQAPMTIEEFVKESKPLPKYAMLFSSEAPNGTDLGGGHTGTRTVQNPPPPQQQVKTANQKIADGLKNRNNFVGTGAGIVIGR